jgi:hypothetical protein
VGISLIVSWGSWGVGADRTENFLDKIIGFVRRWSQIDDLRLWMMNFAYRVGLALLVNLAIVSGVGLAEGNGLTLPATAQENSDEVPSLINQGIKIYQQGYRGYYQYGSIDPDFLFKKRIKKAIAKMEKAYDLSRVAKNDLQQATALLTLGHFHQR